jgi:hypothetical protein
VDEIDRSLLTDEPTNVPRRLSANVMAEVRALSRPAPPRFPWRQLSLKLAPSAGFAAAAAIVFAYIDPAIFVPVARELGVAGLTLALTLVAHVLPGTLREIRE